MIQAVFRLVSPQEKRGEFRDLLLHVKGPAEGMPECRACWVCQDVEDDRVFIYFMQWDTQEDLESQLQSERFRRLLPYIEMSVEPPAVAFGSVEHLRGIEYLVEVLSAATQ
jgi:quinol monooxygenase YgiN